MNFFEFTKSDYDYIVKECMLDEEYQRLLEYKIKGYTRTKMALQLGVSEPTLDRIDNEKDYCPENCRWSTSKFQSNHKTNNVIYTFNGKTQTAKQWCDEYGISHTTLNDRLKRGWTLEQALTISTKGTQRKVFK